ncbi:unnamed protein product [Closterium sp. NIES-54]
MSHFIPLLTLIPTLSPPPSLTPFPLFLVNPLVQGDAGAPVAPLSPGMPRHCCPCVALLIHPCSPSPPTTLLTPPMPAITPVIPIPPVVPISPVVPLSPVPIPPIILIFPILPIPPIPPLQVDFEHEGSPVAPFTSRLPRHILHCRPRVALLVDRCRHVVAKTMLRRTNTVPWGGRDARGCVLEEGGDGCAGM